jgi:two-component system, cell cycle sensor histidine kinase and response regulator CckA
MALMPPPSRDAGDILDAVPEAYLHFDSQSRLTFANRAAQRLLGRDPAGLLGKAILEAYPALAGTPVEERYRRALAERTPIAFECCRETGQNCYAVTFMPGPNGGIIVQVVDITERKRAESALLEREERNRILLEESPDPIFSFTPEGRYTYVNQAFAKGVGKPVEEITGNTIWDVFDKEEADKRFGPLSQVFRTGLAKVIEVRVPRPDGDRYYVTTITPIKDAAGKVVSAICSSKEITGRIRAEETLREREQLLRESQTVARLGSYAVDVATGMWTSSAVMDECFGIDETYHRSVEGWAALIHPGDRAMMADYFRDEVVGRGRAFDKEYRIIRNDSKTERWVHGLGKLDFDAEGRPVRMHGTIQDITDRKRADEERAKLEAQLAQAQKMESIGRLAGGIAHDFNNLLTVINGYATFLSDELNIPDALREYALEIGKAGERAAGLTRQLLAFSRKQIIRPRPIDLNCVVADSERMLRRLIGEDIELLTTLAPDLGTVTADPDQIHHVIMNLAVNARDAMPGGGKLEIATADVELDEAAAALHADATPGRFVQLTVADTGTGMTEEVRKNVFEPFFTTKETGKGTGLGLAMVYGILRQSNGWIDAQSELGKGSTFRIYLPRIENAPAAEEPRPEADALRGEETVLVVEDQEGVRRLAKAILKARGYHILEASNGAEAHAIARQHAGKIDLLLTDVVMPGLDGQALSEQLRESRPKLKVILMSGYSEDVIASRGALASNLVYIQKPFSPNDLAAKVREVLAVQAGPDRGPAAVAHAPRKRRR